MGVWDRLGKFNVPQMKPPFGSLTYGSLTFGSLTPSYLSSNSFLTLLSLIPLLCFIYHWHTTSFIGVILLTKSITELREINFATISGSGIGVYVPLSLINIYEACSLPSRPSDQGKSNLAFALILSHAKISLFISFLNICLKHWFSSCLRCPTLDV